MMKIQTAKIAHGDILTGNKLYEQRARKALPYIVRQAKAGQTIFYSDLAEEINIPNPRNLNFPLGAIGQALITLGKSTNTIIPPIQCLVINKGTGLPGDGIEWFISQTAFNKLTKSQKRELVNRQLTNIFAYPNWDWVLNQFDLEPVKSNVADIIDKAKKIGFGHGESEQHKNFKEYLAQNPSLLGLKVSVGTIEYKLPSSDSIDILFTDKGQIIGVEVKSSISDTPDILRGLFQCVKYKHLIEAEQAVKNKTPDSRVILALQGLFPTELISVRNILGIEVIDKIKTSPQ